MSIRQKANKKNKPLKQYYANYYNENYLRDYRYIFDDEKIHKYNDVLTRKNFRGGEIRALTFLNHRNHTGVNGTLLNELTYFKSLDDYKEANNDERYSDRLFFDFDIEDDRVTSIKTEMKEVIASANDDVKQEMLDDLKSDFRDLIFDEDLILPTFQEASSLCSYLEKEGLKPYLIFSGSKGFHINIFFDELKLMNISKISYSLASSYKEKLDLKYLDLAVNKDAKKRSQRVQYSYHSKTNLLTLPLSRDLSYDEVLAIIEKNKRNPIEFNLGDYKASEDFNKSLVRYDDSINVKLLKRQRELDAINKQRQKRAKRKYNGQVKSFREIDMKELVRAYGIDGKDKGDRIIVKCPFHSDNNPSAVVFDKRFYCSTCNMSLNYYDFISKMEETTDKATIMKKLNDLLE